MKRALDLVAALALLVLLSPVLAVALVAVRLSLPGPALYRARRVGKDGREFDMFKLRTMSAGHGPRITAAGDPRITRVGRILRDARLDELPQLWNVLTGDMSLVGPRPEDPAIVARYSAEERAVLSVRPGVTGAAQLMFRHEERMLPADDPETAYVRDILPAKLRVDLQYVRSRSLWGDVGILARTLRPGGGAGPQPVGRTSTR